MKTLVPTATAPSGTLVVKGLGRVALPAIISRAGEHASKKFVEFFTAAIRNANTRRAYGRAVLRFMVWCQSRRLDLGEIEPMHVAAYIEQLTKQISAASVKLQLAGIRMLFD